MNMGFNIILLCRDKILCTERERESGRQRGIMNEGRKGNTNSPDTNKLIWLRVGWGDICNDTNKRGRSHSQLYCIYS